MRLLEGSGGNKKLLKKGLSLFKKGKYSLAGKIAGRRYIRLTKNFDKALEKRKGSDMGLSDLVKHNSKRNVKTKGVGLKESTNYKWRVTGGQGGEALFDSLAQAMSWMKKNTKQDYCYLSLSKTLVQLNPKTVKDPKKPSPEIAKAY